MIKTLIVCVALSVCALGLQAGDGVCPASKGACPPVEKGCCDKAKDAKGGTCPGKKDDATKKDAGKKA